MSFFLKRKKYMPFLSKPIQDKFILTHTYFLKEGYVYFKFNTFYYFTIHYVGAVS